MVVPPAGVAVAPGDSAADAAGDSLGTTEEDGASGVASAVGISTDGSEVGGGVAGVPRGPDMGVQAPAARPTAARMAMANGARAERITVRSSCGFRQTHIVARFHVGLIARR